MASTELRWPTFEEVDDRLYKSVGDVHEVMRRLSPELLYPPAQAVAPSAAHDLRLTIAGVQWCAESALDPALMHGARSAVSDFLRFVQWAAQRRSSPPVGKLRDVGYRDAIELGVTVVARLTVLGMMIQVEPWGWDQFGGTGQMEWTVTPGRDSRKYAGVGTIEEYWALRPKPSVNGQVTDVSFLMSRLPPTRDPVAYATSLVSESAQSLDDPSAIQQEIDRIIRDLEGGDTGGVIGAAKNLVESVASIVIAQNRPGGSDKSGERRMQTLAGQAMTLLSVDPGSNTDLRSARDLLAKLGAIPQHVAELRNAVGDGHGRVTAPLVEFRYGRMAALAAIAWAEFMLEALVDAANSDSTLG